MNDFSSYIHQFVMTNCDWKNVRGANKMIVGKIVK